MRTLKYFYHYKGATTIESIDMMLTHSCDEYGLLEFKDFFDSSMVYKKKMNEDFLCENLHSLNMSYLLLYQCEFYTTNSNLYKKLKSDVFPTTDIDMFFINIFTF